MSRIYENGYVIRYPNALAYSGMPAIVNVHNIDSTYIGVGLTIQVGDSYYTEAREPYNGEVSFDISRYMQLAFLDLAKGYAFGDDDSNVARISQLSPSISVVVQLTAEGGSVETAHTFRTRALIGYLGIGQRNGGASITRRWFKNYPQTFDFYGDSYTVVSIETIDNPSGVVVECESPSELCQQYADLSPFMEAYAVFPSIRDNEKSVTLKISDSYYLNGDSLRQADTVYNLIIDRCTSGIYLRWLDHFGHWCYYLFRVTGRNYTTKETQSWQDGILRNENVVDENHVYLQSGQLNVQLSQQESLSLGAKLVDAETFDFLLSLTSSPIVEVLVNADEYIDDNTITPEWERVSIVAGSYARTNAPLQDFIVSIARAAHISQML